VPYIHVYMYLYKLRSVRYKKFEISDRIRGLCGPELSESCLILLKWAVWGFHWSSMGRIYHLSETYWCGLRFICLQDENDYLPSIPRS